MYRCPYCGDSMYRNDLRRIFIDFGGESFFWGYPGWGWDYQGWGGWDGHDHHGYHGSHGGHGHRRIED